MASVVAGAALMRERVGASLGWLRSALDLEIVGQLVLSTSLIVLYGAALLGTAGWVFHLASHGWRF